MSSRFEIPNEDVLRAREKLVLDHFHDELAQDSRAREPIDLVETSDIHARCEQVDLASVSPEPVP